MISTPLPEKNGIFVFVYGAVICTFFSVMLFVAFLKQRKKLCFKLHSTICLLTSVVGTSLLWLAPIVDIYQKEASLLRLKLVMLGGAFILYPFALFGDWFGDYLVITFKLQRRTQRILFHIGKIAIRFSDIMKVIVMIFFGYLFLLIMLMK